VQPPVFGEINLAYLTRADSRKNAMVDDSGAGGRFSHSCLFTLEAALAQGQKKQKAKVLGVPPLAVCRKRDSLCGSVKLAKKSFTAESQSL
jgi:hypothetical protein